VKRPPVFLRFKIKGERWLPGCWLPLFLLLPLIAVLLIILTPFILIAALIMRLSGRGQRQLRVIKAAFSVIFSLSRIKAAFDLLCSTTGFRVDVSGDNERVHISII
jgi:hypothetical protein